jgi:outer membrane protein N
MWPVHGALWPAPRARSSSPEKLLRENGRSDMRRLAPVTLVLLVLVPSAAGAQAPAAAQQATLQQVVNEQLRRIEALEAQLAQLRQEVNAIRTVAQPPVEEAPEVKEPFVHAADGNPPTDPDSASPTADLPRALNIDSYGSLRVLTLWDVKGHSEVSNNSSRIGIRGEKPLFGQFIAFGRYETGINLVANDRTILLSGGDPGTPIGQGSQAIFSRLGFVGIKTPIGDFSWGKQWAPYYDIAEFSDQLVVFSGLASGAFGAGTDGGLAGTGRAERALLYRETWGPVAVGLQVQDRTLTANDRHWADTFSGSLIYGRRYGFAVGAAYNEVRDGVLNPTPNEPQLGDKAAIFGARFRGEQFYVGGIFSILTQHEVDDLGRRFDGNGFEFAARRNLLPRLWLEGAFNDLSPNSDHPGVFRVRFGAANVVYDFSVASRLFFGFKLEDSKNSDGTPLTRSTFAGGLNYTF